jgi:nucleotide-binding universal stress UspA family protein
MYRHILIPTDGSDLAGKAVQHGIGFAKEVGARITALTVSEPFPMMAAYPAVIQDAPASYRERSAEYAGRVLDAVANAVKAAGVACETVHVEAGQPYQAIIDTAESKQCDLIVMASHGRRGVSAIVLGSETVKVLTHSKIPVLVYR